MALLVYCALLHVLYVCVQHVCIETVLCVQASTCQMCTIMCLPSEDSLVSADVTNVEAELLKNAARDSAQVSELQARIKELEMEQSLMQRELDNMSDVAQRTDNQLRFVVS